MKNVNLLDICTEFEILKDKLDDLQTVHGYFADNYFTERVLQTKSDLMRHGIGYQEQRIKTDQINELMRLYVTEFESIIKQLKTEVGGQEND